MESLKIGRVELPGVRFLVRRLADGIQLYDGVIQSGETFANGSVLARTWEADLKAHMLAGDVVPLVWGRRDEFDGFYRIRMVDLVTRQGSANYPFSVDLAYVGRQTFTPGDTVFESGLTGTYLANPHGVSAAAEPIHAPPPHGMYDPGDTVPAFVDRPIAERLEALRVYRDIAYGSRPQWTCDPKDFYAGRCRFERTAAMLPARGELVGRAFNGPVHGLRMSNGMVRVTGSPVASPLLEFWDGAAWRSKVVDVLVDGVEGGWSGISVLQNRPELCAMRLYRPEAGGGAVRLDLTLRPGMRAAMGYLTRHAAAVLGIRNGEGAPAMTATAERMRQNAASADTHRLVFSSSKAYTVDAAAGTMSVAAAVAFDFAVSAELGAAPVLADQALALSMQYLGSGFGETTTPARA